MSGRRGRADRRAAPPIYVAIEIAAPIDEVWRLSQDPAEHVRWDLRFTSIEPVGETESGGTRFRYSRTIPFHAIVGTGTTIGERARPDGTRTSALRFDTRDPLSPLGDGRGYWRYRPTERGTLFVTGYDYAPGWGRALDRVVRPLVGWATAWSFDRLRIWAERGEEPERWPLHSVLWFWRRDRPRAARCTRRPADGRVMAAAPETLDRLEAP